MAQERRNQQLQQMARRRQRRIAALCTAGGIVLALAGIGVSFLYIRSLEQDAPLSAPAATALPYDASSAFSLADLTAAQIAQIRQQGRLSVSDGPRGISVGDPFDRITQRYPTTYAGEQPEDFEILYCAQTLGAQNGSLIAVPPRGVLTAEVSSITVTLMAPTAAYPPGSEAAFASFEHVYCIYTINPDTMTVSSIVLGID